MVNPVRLLVLGVLFYILYRLLTAGRRRHAGKQAGPEEGGRARTIQDVLVEDPVCRTHIPKTQAIQLYHDGRIYYFCSNDCCEKFLKRDGQ